jgi:predicted amidophosphoribosyltransferase
VRALQSTYLGGDESGRPTFDTRRSAIGELLYRLKYKDDRSVLPELIDIAASFYYQWAPGCSKVVPAPPSRFRAFQPVQAIAQGLATRLGLEYLPAAVVRTRDVPELKSVEDYAQRAQLLNGLHTADRSQLAGQTVLLFDDLYRSGATPARGHGAAGHGAWRWWTPSPSLTESRPQYA